MSAVEFAHRTPIRTSIVIALLRKDLLAARRSKAVVVPMIAVPAVLLLLLPAAIGVFVRTRPSAQLSAVLSRLPSSMTGEFGASPQSHQLIELVLGFLIAPLFLIVPLMVSSALAADTFAGEKERRTLESLLHLPVDEREMFLSKVLFALLPAVSISWIGFALYTVIADVISWPLLHRPLLPTARWLALIGWVAPAVAALGLGIMVRVSARASTTQEANQLGGAVIMPLILAAVGQTTGLLLLDPEWILLGGAIIWIVAWLLIRGGMRRFQRDQIAMQL